jgi:intracellular septation protein A
VYVVVRSLVSSDALALGIAGAVPVLYSVVVAVVRRRIDLFALVSGIGFSVAALVSVLTGGSSLPLKLDEAVITFAIGLVLLVAALIRRPVPIGRLLRMPVADKQIDGPLGVAVGGFLVLHALVHVALAVELSTSSYLVLSRVVNWGTIVLGVLGLAAYRRHLSARG